MSPPLPRLPTLVPALLLPATLLTGGCSTGSLDKPGGVLTEADSGTSGTDTGSPDTAGGDTGASDTGASDTGGAETGAADTGGTDTAPPETAWCLDFEDGTLESVGHEGAYVELGDGGLVMNVEEGDDWSALVGEEEVVLRGNRGLVLRSSHLGDPASEGVALTAPFEVTHDELWFWQLSEVDDRGIALTAELLDAATEELLVSTELPARTGGYVPELQDHHLPIDGFPEISTDGGSPGALTQVVVDISAWRDRTVRLRLRQRTRVADNGFFTLLDDLCHGRSESSPSMEWSLKAPSRAPVPR